MSINVGEKVVSRDDNVSQDWLLDSNCFTLLSFLSYPITTFTEICTVEKAAAQEKRLLSRKPQSSLVWCVSDRD